MLQGIQAQIRLMRHRLAGRTNSEDAARFFQHVRIGDGDVSGVVGREHAPMIACIAADSTNRLPGIRATCRGSIRCPDFPWVGCAAMPRSTRRRPTAPGDHDAGPRVVLLTTNYGRGGSGAERQLERVLAVLADRGWAPTVVARRDGVEAPDDGPLPVVRVARAGVGPLRALQFTLAAARTTARLQPDVVISLQLGSNLLAAAIVPLFARRHIPALVRLTGLTEHGSQLEARGRTPLTRLVTAMLLRRMAVVASPAQHLLDRCGRFCAIVGPRGRVVRNGAPQVTERPGPNPDGPVVWVGRDDRRKQLDHFVSLARDLPEVQFVAAGVDLDPASRPPNLSTTGRLSGPAVLELVGSARAFVSTSSREGVPNTLLETITLGVPLVAYDIAGNAEAVVGVTHGARLVPLDDVDALRAALVETLADPRGIEGSVPDIVEVSGDWEQLLRSVIAGDGPAGRPNS